MKNVSKLLVALLAVTAVSASAAPKQWLDYKGRKGPGKGKNIVLISGDGYLRQSDWDLLRGDRLPFGHAPRRTWS